MLIGIVISLILLFTNELMNEENVFEILIINIRFYCVLNWKKIFSNILEKFVFVL